MVLEWPDVPGVLGVPGGSCTAPSIPLVPVPRAFTMCTCSMVDSHIYLFGCVLSGEVVY